MSLSPHQPIFQATQGRLHVYKHQFICPIQHSTPEGGKLSCFAGSPAVVCKVSLMCHKDATFPVGGCLENSHSDVFFLSMSCRRVEGLHIYHRVFGIFALPSLLLFMSGCTLFLWLLPLRGDFVLFFAFFSLCGLGFLFIYFSASLSLPYP